jgi:glycosyltransferase involved in cell wall biosynthesis
MGFFSATPRAYLDMYSAEMEQRIKAVLSEQDIDLVIASQTDMATYASAYAGKPAVFEEVEVGVWRDQMLNAHSISARLRSSLTWAKHRRFLAGLMRYFRFCTVVSEKERLLLQQEISMEMRIEVVPNCVDLKDYQDTLASPVPESLIFTGSLTYRPNYEAICWFLEEVFPHVLEQAPQARLVITGDHSGLPLPDTNGVILTGLLPDVRPAIASAWCSVVPLRTGGGTRLKILEAMALHTPVVATSKGAEGLSIEPGKEALIADEAQKFAECILRLFRKPELRQQVAEDAFRLIQARYNWETVMASYLELIDFMVPAKASKGTQFRTSNPKMVHRR